MAARRKLCYPAIPDMMHLWRELDQTLKEYRQQEAIYKDRLLIEAACAADNIVISRDEAMKKLLQVAASAVAQLADLMWINPVTDREHATAWLLAGANQSASYRLRSAQ